MQQIKWFERKFDFANQQNILPAIIERLKGTSTRIKTLLENYDIEKQKIQIDNSWSILENIGHLVDLEPLWYGRLDDIISNKEFLRDADLSNTQTHQANHNEQSLDSLVDQFQAFRFQTILQLEQLNEASVFKSALHPRLKQPMRTMDLFLFVAEHDDHHLARISELKRLIQ